MNPVLTSLIRLRSLLAKEFRQLLRDPRMRFFVVVPPLVQLVVFGYGATFEVRHADIAVVDPAEIQLTRAIVHAVTAGGHYSAHYYPDMAAAAAAIDHGELRAVLRFNADFGTDPRIQLIADGSDSNSAQLVVGQLQQTIRDFFIRRQGATPLIEVAERAWFNQNLDDRAYFVPGIIANVVLIATLILTAMTVVRERELGTLERLMVTPIARLEFILAKMIPVACVGLFDVFLVTMVGVLWFGVPFRGEPLALLLGTALFLGSSLGLGLLISTYSATQQQAVLLAFFLIMPAVILSGFAFPIANMPEAVQWVTYVDPLRYYIVVIRDLFLKGGGVSDHLYENGMMLLLAVTALGLSARRVR